MANRLTKGKALVGSLDVQGELTVNGAPVGSGGGGGTGPEMVYTAWLSTDSMYSNENWYPNMGYFSIRNNGPMEMFPRSAYQQNFISDNNIQEGDTFTVKTEKYDPVNGTWVPYKAYLTRGVAFYDMMANGTIVAIVGYGGSMGMSGGPVTPRFTLQKEG